MTALPLSLPAGVLALMAFGMTPNVCSAALIQTNHVRLRPILMTTISIVAGMLPIAFGRGAGAGSRASMAVTIIGGQILCLLLTLLITPVVYSYFDGLRTWRPSDLLNPFRKLARPVPVAATVPSYDAKAE